MNARAMFLLFAFLAGCATAAPDPALDPVAAAPEVAPETRAPPSATAGPSDWALAIVGTPFVFAFRTVVCAATAVVAAPTAGLLALTEESREGLGYLRYGLAENCGPPYVLSVPIAAGYGAEPDVRYAPQPEVPVYPEPDLGAPRPLIP